MTATLDLWPIGNCQVSALVDRAGRFVWGCLPRVDGDPAFCSLLDDDLASDMAGMVQTKSETVLILVRSKCKEWGTMVRIGA